MRNMYSAFLMIHNLLRWVVLLLAILVVVRAVLGVTGRREWAAADQTAGQWFGRMMDLQLLLGLVLYTFLSPFVRDAFADFGAAMRNPPLRFFAVEHLVGMIVAVALVHIGTARIKKAKDAAQRHKSALIFYALALVIMLLSIPWPGTAGGRPLLRGFDSSQNP
jgi:cytochrome c biogenesis factor